MQTANLQAQIRELLPYSSISEDRKRRVMERLATLSGHDLLKVLMALQKEREGMMDILKKKEALDLKFEILKQKFS